MSVPFPLLVGRNVALSPAPILSPFGRNDVEFVSFPPLVGRSVVLPPFGGNQPPATSFPPFGGNVVSSPAPAPILSPSGGTVATGSTVPFRRIINETCLVVQFALHLPTWPCLEYYGRGTEPYDTISKWFDGKPPFGHFMADNYRVYDTLNDRYVVLRLDALDEFYLKLAFDKIFPPGIAKFIGLDEDVTFVEERAFPNFMIGSLELLGAIGPRVEIPSGMLEL